mgnify:CR=1 FL=1
MELNQQQVQTATALKGNGLFPSQIADKLGLPRGAVRRFFKEKRRVAMTQAEKEYGPGPKQAPTKPPTSREDEIRALSGDGSNYTYEGVKHAQAQGIKFADIADAWGDDMVTLRQWMCGEGSKRYAANRKAQTAVTVVATETKTKPWTEEDKAAAKAMLASGVDWRTVAAHLSIPPRAVNAWRMAQLSAAKRAVKLAVQPVTPVPVFVPDAATQPVFAVPEPVIALPQAASLPTITNHAAVALAWTGYAAWMTRDGVKPLMFTEADVDMLMKVYDTVVAGK